VLFGLGWLTLWSALHLVMPGPAPARRLAPLPLLALTSACWLAVSLLNPYGIRLLLALLRASVPASRHIPEWHPLDITSELGAPYALLCLGAGACYGVSPQPRRRLHTALLVIGASLPLLAQRHIPLSAIILVMLSAPHLMPALHRMGLRRPAPPPRLAVTVSALLLSCGLAISAVRRVPCIPLRLSASPPIPVRALATLAASGVSATAVMPYPWGSHALWFLRGRLRPQSDARREAPLTRDTLRTDLNFQYGLEDWDRLLTRYRPDLVLVPPAQPSHALMSRAPGWRAVYADPVATIFARDGSPIASRLAATRPPAIPADGEGSCLSEQLPTPRGRAS
jgi:hypothetical protein